MHPISAYCYTTSRKHHSLQPVLLFAIVVFHIQYHYYTANLQYTTVL